MIITKILLVLLVLLYGLGMPTMVSRVKNQTATTTQPGAVVFGIILLILSLLALCEQFGWLVIA